jgi:Flp pilus assembly protein TadG
MAERTGFARKNKLSSMLISDRRGAVAFEMIIVYLFIITSLFLPLADVAIAGLKYSSAYQALRDMGQLTQYSSLDATDSASISTWQSSLPTTVDGYTVSATIKCGDAGSAPPCAGTTWPKYYSFSTSFTLSPMVLPASMLCRTCTVSYSQRFQ